MALSRGKKRISASLVITLAVIVLFLLLYQIPPIKTAYEILELKMLDFRFILEPQPPRSGKIVHIDIDDETIKKIGWPCPRRYYADLIDILTECGTRSIIFDISFLEPGHLSIDRTKASELKEDIKARQNEAEEDIAKISERLSGQGTQDVQPYLLQLKDGFKEALYLLDQKLEKSILDQDALVADAIKRNHDIFLPFFFPEAPGKKIDPAEEARFIENFSLPIEKPKIKNADFYKGAHVELPIDTFSRHVTGIGFVNAGALLDKDGAMRRIPLLWEYKGKLFPQLTFAAFLESIKCPGQEIEIVPGKYIKIKETVIPVDEKMNTIIHWVAKWNEDFRHIPFHDIIELKNIRDILEQNFIAVDEKNPYGRLKELEKEAELNPASSADLLKEIDEAKKEIIRSLEKNIAAIPQGEAKLDELKKDYDALIAAGNKEKRLKEKITGFVKGKTCFVGLTGTATHDRRPIPLQPDYPMIGLHSNLLNTILTKNFIREAPANANFLIFISLGLVIALATPNLTPWKGMGISLIALLAFISLGQYLFQKHGLAINMVGPILVIIFSFIATTSYRYITEEKEKKWVRKAFSHYLSPKVMEEILTDPSKLGLGGKREELTVLFSDIRGFTSYCEKRAPEEIIPILNEYLDVMSNVIFKYNGTLDKYVGDEIVAFFGAPAMKEPINHAEMAIRTGLEMVAELKKLQEKWKSEGKEPLDFGVGINTGPMMVGNMGSTNRLNYTVIGDEVNLGARVEALTREYNVRIIITQSTYDKVKDMVEVKRLGEVMVKGKAQPVIVYELISLRT